MNIDTSTYNKTIRFPATLGELPIGWGNTNLGRRPGKPRSILIHTTNNPHPNTTFEQEAAFLFKDHLVSANYIVGRAGQIAVIVPDNLVAWHSGDCVDNDYENTWSIGIEIHWSPANGYMPDSIVQTVTELVRSILARYPDIKKIDTHRAQAVPKGRKTDPDGWDDTRFYSWRSEMLSQNNNTGYTGYTKYGKIEYYKVIRGPARVRTSPHFGDNIVRTLPVGEIIGIDSSTVYGDYWEGSNIWSHYATDEGFIHSLLLEKV